MVLLAVLSISVSSFATFAQVHAEGNPDPPKDIQIDIIGNTAKISWIIPTNQGVTFSRITLSNSKDDDMYLDSERRIKDIPVSTSSFEIANLKMCSEYNVRIQCISGSTFSDFITQKFWMTNTTFTADINQNVSLSWTTSLKDFFSVQTPFPYKPIYDVQVGTIILNAKLNKYIIDTMPKDLHTINVTIIQVNKYDAGVYRAVGDGNVDGCCLLVVTGKPRNVTVKSTQIKTEVNTSEIIMMHVVSFPAPTVEWRRETGFQWTVTKDKYDYRYKIQSKIHMKSNVDFGEYGINICNRLGCNVQNIILRPKDLRNKKNIKSYQVEIGLAAGITARIAAGIATLVVGLAALALFFFIRKLLIHMENVE